MLKSEMGYGAYDGCLEGNYAERKPAIIEPKVEGPEPTPELKLPDGYELCTNGEADLASFRGAGYDTWEDWIDADLYAYSDPAEEYRFCRKVSAQHEPEASIKQSLTVEEGCCIKCGDKTARKHWGQWECPMCAFKKKRKQETYVGEPKAEPVEWRDVSRTTINTCLEHFRNTSNNVFIVDTLSAAFEQLQSEVDLLKLAVNGGTE